MTGHERMDKQVKLLVTGGAGFIGSNFINYILPRHLEIKVINLDKLTYAANLANLRGVEESPRYHFIHGDICDPTAVAKAFAYGITHVIHFAAESHVDRSIAGPSVFMQTNIIGTQVLLDAALANGIDMFIQVSTDEVYGSIDPPGRFTESSLLAPNNPYAASKAAAEMVARSYWRTYRLPVVITRCSNNYGPNQHREKLIPLTITKALRDEPIPVYGDGLNVRDWLYVEDHCRALDLLLQGGRPGEVYNIGGKFPNTNLEVVRSILSRLGKSDSLISFVSDRPGHDRRYALDSSKLERELGWQPQISFEEGLEKTLQAYTSV